MRRKFAPLAAFDCEAANEAAISPGLAELRVCANGKSLRETLLSKAVVAVHHCFIQRETMGLRRHDGVIREYRIPPEAPARLGAR